MAPNDRCDRYNQGPKLKTDHSEGKRLSGFTLVMYSNDKKKLLKK